MLAWATVRHRWPSFAGGFIALALGVALLTATLAVYASAQPAVPDRYAGTAVVVHSPAAGDDQFAERLPWSPQRLAALVADLSAIPGVAAAIPDRSFYAQLSSGGRLLDDPVAGDPLGRAWSVTALAPYRLVAGAPPRSRGEVAVGREYGLSPGERVTLLTATGPEPVTVTGVLDGSGIYVDDATARQLSSGVTVIGLVSEPGAEVEAVARAARAVVGTAGEVLTGAARTALEPVAHAQIRWVGTQLLTVMVTLAAFAAIFVVASTFSLAAHQRRRELALIRALGATPRQLRLLLLGESLLVGVLAAGCGAGLGALLAPGLGDLLVRAEMEPPGFTARATPAAVAAAVGTGLVVCLLGVWLGSRRAARIPPLAALREATVDRQVMTRTRWAGGGILTATGLVLAVATAAAEPDAALTTAVGSALSLIAGLALLAPAFVPTVVRVVTAPLVRSAGAIGLLVREHAVSAVRRTAATAGPVLLTVGFSGLVFGMVATMAPVFGSETAHRLGAEVVVRPDGTPGLSDAAVAAVPGTAISAVTSTVYITGGGQPTAVDAAGIDAATLATVAETFTVEHGAVTGWTDAPPPGRAGEIPMVVTGEASDAYGWQVGDTPELTFADGRPGRVQVVAVVSDASLPRPVLLPRATLRAHDSSALTDLVFVAGADTATVAAALTGLGATAVDAATYAAADSEDRLVWIFAWIMVGLSVGYTGIAVANTLMMTTAGRRRDFAVLRRSGATTGQLLGLVSAETLLVVGFGTLLGFLVALPALLGIRSALTALVDRPVALMLPWPHLAAAVGACAVLALAAALASARLALRAASG